jgi:hypothetical protein
MCVTSLGRPYEKIHKSIRYSLKENMSERRLGSDRPHGTGAGLRSQICGLVTFTAGGGVGLQWPSDEQGGRVPPGAVVPVSAHPVVLAWLTLSRIVSGSVRG